MAPENQPVQLIANESNTVTEIESGPNTPAAEHQTTAEKAKALEQPAESSPAISATRSNDEVATNDGALVETLDTAFHNKPGVAEGENLTGSSRADYYESRSYGKTDAEEELDALKNK